ncbi:hypothetical protein J5N97_006210 [Dioscorea zingiberensis]|uniref:ubiquitinyl hydrolase 1 n=1 Tax=Dioscorea zingiberensis TaxID=325984 RepID=A0A9D5DAI0_9LILI|nr:hypothetical protein J5N97_006210 [Dioscorea zingiberensis]
MEAPSNGGLLYHEVQESKLCAVHCVNTVLQGPFFSEIDLAALASDLDRRERQMMLEGGDGGLSGDFFSEDSHNVSMGGDFSIQVLQKALEVWDLQVIPLDSPIAEPSKYDPELESAFICHLHNHWFCIRKGSGWSIFLVRGNFPKDCPMSSEGSNGFGEWLTPEDAERITKSCNQNLVPTQNDGSSPSLRSTQIVGEEDALLKQEEEDLNAAIAASLMDSSAFNSGAGMTQEQSCLVESPVLGPEKNVSRTDRDTADTEVANAQTGETQVPNSSSPPVVDEPPISSEDHKEV